MTSNNIIFLIGISLWICSCKSTTKPYKLELGKYQSKSFNKIELTIKRLVYNELPSIGQELNLHQDSSFVLSTCSNIISGTFFIKNDSLILTCIKNISIKDTTKITLYSPSSQLSYCIINNNTLYRFDNSKINNKNVILSDNLIKPDK